MQEPSDVDRKKFMAAYLDNATTLLSKWVRQDNNPNMEIDTEIIQAFVKRAVAKSYKPLTADMVVNPNYGSAELKHDVDVLKFFNYHSKRVIAPSGSIYYNVNEKKSLMYEFIQHYLSTRKILKKEMLKAEEIGDKVVAQIKNYGQATVKIRANSLIGGTGSEFSFCYNKAAFNSVTSMSRNTIMNAYALTERFLAGNFYFPTYDHLLNYMTVVLGHFPGIDACKEFFDKYPLMCPDFNDVLTLFVGYLSEYTNDIDVHQLRLLLSGLHPYELAYLFYANNFHLLAHANRDLIKSLVVDVFDESKVDYSDMENIDPYELFKYDGDLLIVLNTHYLHILGDVSLYDTPKEAPEIAKKLVCIARYMVQKITPLMEVIAFFNDNHTSIANTIAHKSMYRKVVSNSDTDSVIFTTKEWVKWYTGNYNFTTDAYDIDVLITYCLSKVVAWLMYTISVQRGSLGKDVYAMNMKNEFLYPVMMSCIIPKHYVGIQTMREGHVLPKPKLDIKGVSFRGSSMQKITLDHTEDFTTSIIYDIYRKDHPEAVGEVSIHHYINNVIDYEIHILRSLRRGETTYLNVDPVKAASEYAVPESSIYFNYQFWCAVFEEKYGEIQIPTKCHVVPLNANQFYTDSYQSFLQAKFPDIYAKLIPYLQKIGKKRITRVPINPALGTIPEELIPLIDGKLIAYKNCSPLYLALESLGLSSGIPTGKKVLFVDLFGVGEDVIYGEEHS